LNWPHLVGRDDIAGGEIEIHQDITVVRALIVSVCLAKTGLVRFALEQGRQRTVTGTTWHECPISSFEIKTSSPLPQKWDSNFIYFSIGQIGYGLIYLKKLPDPTLSGF